MSAYIENLKSIAYVLTLIATHHYMQENLVLFKDLGQSEIALHSSRFLKILLMFKLKIWSMKALFNCM